MSSSDNNTFGIGMRSYLFFFFSLKLILYIDREELEIMLESYQKKHVNSQWIPKLSRNWAIVKISGGRKEFIEKLSEYEEIHSELSKLHPIAVMEFLKLYGECQPKRSFIPSIWKGKLILYRLITGKSSHCMPLLSYPSYRRVEEEFWKNSSLIKKWASNWLKCLSDPTVRAIFSRLNNPNPFKAVTIFADGKDFVTTLNELKIERKKTKKGKSTLLSRKNGFKNGGKIIFVDDVDIYPIAVSRVVGANEKYDGHLFKDMKIFRKIDANTDNFMFDNHFVSVIDDIIEEANEEGIPLSRDHFTHAIRKNPGLSFNDDEQDYNTIFGQFRSKHESLRMTIGSTFKGLTKGRKSNFEMLYLQINICIILSSISRKCESLPRLFDNIDVAWIDPNFNYPTEEILHTSPSLVELDSFRSNMEKRQEEALLSLKNQDNAHPFDEFAYEDEEFNRESEYNNNSDDKDDDERRLEVNIEENQPFEHILREIEADFRGFKRKRKNSPRYIEFKKKVTNFKRMKARKRRNTKIFQ